MATTGTLEIKGKDDDGNDKSVTIYRCCDFFKDVIMELIEKAYKGFHGICEPDGYSECQCNPEIIRAVIFAEEYIEAKQRGSFHICMEPDSPCGSDSGDMVLDITDAFKWVLTYKDWDENDKEIQITKTLTKQGWQ